MHHIDKDRTGEECPFCHKGKLLPTSYSSVERNEKVQQGEFARTEREYECDTCGKKTSGKGVGLKENAISRETSVTATSNTEPPKEK